MPYPSRPAFPPACALLVEEKPAPCEAIIMNIVINDAAAARLTSLLSQENSDAFVRIRETKIGDG